MKKFNRSGALTILVAIGAATALNAAGATASVTEEPLPTIIGGGNRTLSVTIVRPHGAFSVDPQRFRVSLTDVRTHAHIDVKASESRLVASHVETRKWYSIEYRDADMVDLHYPLRANIAASMYSLRFETNYGVRDREGRPLDVGSRSTPSLVYAPPIRPDSGEDANVRALKRQYGGRYVYGIGSGVYESCGEDDQTRSDAAQPALLTSIRRKFGSAETWTMGGSAGQRYLDTESSFLAIDPIEMTFATPTSNDFAGCRFGHWEVADRWEFERTISLEHPYLRRRWPSHFRNAVRNETIVAGMTPAMVAEVWGYPSVFGSREEMERLKLWTYAASPPFEHAVRFRNGRVIAIDPPGRLP